VRLAIAVAVILVGTAVAIAVASDRAVKQPSVTAPSETQASCEATVEWRGTTYLGTRVGRMPTRIGRLGAGVIPSCNDTIPPHPSDSSSVAVFAVEGISPQAAITVAGDPSTLYIGRGFFPQLPGTALHEAAYGPDGGRPDEAGSTCRSTATSAELTGKVRSVSFGVLWLDVSSGGQGLPRLVTIFPDARTKVESSATPLPHVNLGDVVRADVLVCRKTNSPRFLKLVATRLVIGPTNGIREWFLQLLRSIGLA
jgi:hypothetical protein